VRVPRNVKKGQANVTVAIPGWNGITIASPSFEMTVVD
jgi:hypothetical protein